jgi:hypothetical protein
MPKSHLVKILNFLDCEWRKARKGRSTHSPDRKAAVRDLSGLNGGKVPDCCPIERVWPTAVVAEECELAFQQFSGYSRRLKGCFPESSNSGRLLSDDISVVRMTNLGGQL